MRRGCHTIGGTTSTARNGHCLPIPRKCSFIYLFSFHYTKTDPTADSDATKSNATTRQRCQPTPSPPQGDDKVHSKTTKMRHSCHETQRTGDATSNATNRCRRVHFPEKVRLFLFPIYYNVNLITENLVASRCDRK